MEKVNNLKFLAKLISEILYTDRWVLLICDGDQGEGKSCFVSHLSKEVSKLNKIPFNYEDNMTYSRNELKKWIDGDGNGKGKKKEYSTILADEIISMFFKRNWYDSQQIDGIELLNKCRDRHLFVEGNIPCFWDLDSAIFSLMTFWVHIHERGVAWVFQRDKNPFSTDKWHRKENEKVFKKYNNPYKSKNFICEVHFTDWGDKEKKEYYEIRNKKRVGTEGQRVKDERYNDIKLQRDDLLRMAFKTNPALTNKDMHNVIPSLGIESIRLIKLGAR